MSYEVDRDSPTWKAVKAHVEERLQMRRKNLEMAGLPSDETENYRGAIEELIFVLELGQAHSDVQTDIGAVVEL